MANTWVDAAGGWPDAASSTAFFDAMQDISDAVAALNPQYTAPTWSGPSTGTPITAAWMNDLEARASVSATASQIFAPAPSGTDDTAMFIALANWSQATGGEVILNYGTYQIQNYSSSTDFAQPRFRGRGRTHTRLKCTSGVAGSTFLKFNGGSGHPSDGCLTDLTLEGSDAASGIVLLELAGVCFFDFSRLLLNGTSAKLAGVGVQYHNQQSGQFSEFNVGHDVIFGDYLTTAIYYKVTSGADSFHGSGVDGNTTIGQPYVSSGYTNTRGRVRIDAAAKPYNAPLSATFFINDPSQPVIENYSGLFPHFFGALRIETFTSSQVYLANTSNGRLALYYSGTFDRCGGPVGLGSLYLTEQFGHVGSNVAMQLKPRSSQRKNIDARSTPTDVCDREVLTEGMNLVSVQILATNYTYAYLLAVFVNPSGTDAVQTVWTALSANTSGTAAPVFSMSDDGHLHLTAGPSAIEIRSHVTPGFGYTT